MYSDVKTQMIYILKIQSKKLYYKIATLWNNILINIFFYIFVTYYMFQTSFNTEHFHLGLPTVIIVDSSSYKRFRSRITNHPNPLILALNSTNIPGKPPKRLNRCSCHDLIEGWKSKTYYCQNTDFSGEAIFYNQCPITEDL